mmetsp:Transcript_25343/g.49583  ORF Transcript_25343/g.49583 Transcript_25343/m.49583 type:complete len:81 (-) Transcript_25343:980-1222(-)
MNLRCTSKHSSTACGGQTNIPLPSSHHLLGYISPCNAHTTHPLDAPCTSSTKELLSPSTSAYFSPSAEDIIACCPSETLT